MAICAGLSSAAPQPIQVPDDALGEASPDSALAHAAIDSRGVAIDGGIQGQTDVGSAAPRVAESTAEAGSFDRENTAVDPTADQRVRPLDELVQSNEGGDDEQQLAPGDETTAVQSDDQKSASNAEASIQLADSPIDSLPNTDELQIRARVSVDEGVASAREASQTEGPEGVLALADRGGAGASWLPRVSGHPETAAGETAIASTVPRQIADSIAAWRHRVTESGQVRFTAWLAPPELGHVWVELTRSVEGITARLAASDERVRSVLESHEPMLRQSLAETGISLAGLDVSGRSQQGFPDQAPPGAMPQEFMLRPGRLLHSTTSRQGARTMRGSIDVMA